MNLIAVPYTVSTYLLKPAVINNNNLGKRIFQVSDDVRETVRAPSCSSVCQFLSRDLLGRCSGHFCLHSTHPQRMSSSRSSILSFHRSLFRLDALALSVIATATWLGGWLGGWVSVTVGIVSKRLNLSENVLDHLVAPSLKHLGPLTPIPNSKGNRPSSGALNTRGVGKLAIFVRFSTYIAVYLGNGAR